MSAHPSLSSPACGGGAEQAKRSEAEGATLQIPLRRAARDTSPVNGGGKRERV